MIQKKHHIVKCRPIEIENDEIKVKGKVMILFIQLQKKAMIFYGLLIFSTDEIFFSDFVHIHIQFNVWHLKWSVLC